MLQVTVKISGSKEFNTKIKKLGKELYMLKSAMGSIGKDLKTYYSSVGLSSQGGVFGAKWQPLNRKYALRKAKKYPGRSPLVASGRLQRGYSYDAGQQSVYVSNDTPYFKYHQSSAPRTKMPRRQSIGINTAVKNIVKSNIQDEIAKKIRTAGL
jgi:phage gpG-like protein